MLWLLVLIIVVLVVYRKKSTFLDFTVSDKQEIQTLKPDVPEEIGLSVAYPQGAVGMEASDALSQPVENASRIISLKSKGSLNNFKPFDDTEKEVYFPAYSKSGEVPKTNTFIGNSGPLNYTDSFDPNDSLGIQSSPGQEATSECQQTYPRVLKYDGMCITEGDIPYTKTIDGKVNPRLVSRWESYTGDYSASEALKAKGGLLFPEI
jgi:hypothetical protein